MRVRDSARWAPFNFLNKKFVAPIFFREKKL
jgi:hypothetical protein